MRWIVNYRLYKLYLKLIKRQRELRPEATVNIGCIRKDAYCSKEAICRFVGKLKPILHTYMCQKRLPILHVYCEMIILFCRSRQEKYFLKWSYASKPCKVSLVSRPINVSPSVEILSNISSIQSLNFLKIVTLVFLRTPLNILQTNKNHVFSCTPN